MSYYFEKIRSSFGRSRSTDKEESPSLYQLPSLHFSPMMSQRDQRWWEDVSTYRSFADRDAASPPSELHLPDQVHHSIEEGRNNSSDALHPTIDHEDEDDPNIVSH